LTEWVYQIRRAIHLSSSTNQQVLEITTSIPNTSIDCLATVDGYVWSASSDFRLRQWGMKNHADYVGSVTQRKQLQVLRHLELPADRVEPRLRVITFMISPLASNEQVWVAVGNYLVVVDLSQAPRGSQSPVPSSPSAVQYLETCHHDSIRLLQRTCLGSANEQMMVLSSARSSMELWEWNSQTKERVGVQQLIPCGCGSKINCGVDVGMFRWLVTDTHICRILMDEKAKEKERVKVIALDESSRHMVGMVVGSDGESVWIGGQRSFSCWK